MKLIKGYHVTQTERKHIQFMLDNNMSSGGTKLTEADRREGEMIRI